MYFRPPKFIKRIFPALVWNMEDKSAVFLTFDDGPHKQITPWVLDTLRKYDAKATFFCIGKNAEQNPAIIERILAEGHAIGNHTYSHTKSLNEKCGLYVEDVDLARTFIKSNLFRPPYGRLTPSKMRRLCDQYHIIMWDILSRDYSRVVTPRGCVKQVVPFIRGGSIIAFHDSLKASRNMRYALPRVLEAICERGLECRPIEF